MFRIVVKSVISILLLVSLNQQSYATVITQTLEDKGAGKWLSNFEITNDSLLTDIEEITLFFDYKSFSNININSVPTDWDPVVVQPEPSIPDDGLVDILALGSLLAPSETLTGLSIMFEWFGAAPTPTPLTFNIVDPNTFVTLDSGNTKLLTASAEVPEPSTFALFFLGLVLMTKQILTKRKGNKHV